MHNRTWPDAGTVVFQSLNHFWLFMTPWTTACQALLFSTISRSLLKFMSFESMMLSNHHMLYCLLLLCLWSFPASESFLVSQLSVSSGHCIGTSTSTSVLPMNIQCWFPLGLTGLVSFQLLAKSVNNGCGVHQSINHYSQHPPTPPPSQHPATVHPEGIQDGKKTGYLP